MKIKQIVRFGAAVAALAFGVSASAQTLSLGTGGPSGVYYPLGIGIAGVLSAKGIPTKAEQSGGSLDNLRMISRRPSIGFSMSDVAHDAFAGQGQFPSKVPVRTLISVYPNHAHVIVKDGSPINKITDLKGKHVATGGVGSATEIMAFRLLEAAGLDRTKDLKTEAIDTAQAMAALQAGKLDAVMWVGGVPTPAVSNTIKSGFKIKLIDHADLVPALNKKYGNLYTADTIGKSVYGLKSDNKQVSVMNLLVAREDMDETQAYNIVKAIFENKDVLVKAHEEGKNLSLDHQKAANSPIPFHPGALKYFKEKGAK